MAGKATKVGFNVNLDSRAPDPARQIEDKHMNYAAEGK